MTNESRAVLPVFERLQQSFVLGKTRTYAWRKAQLDALQRMLSENEQAFAEALRADLGKSETEAFTTEIGFLISDIRHTKKHLRQWMKAQKVSTPVLAQPARSYLQPEPLGTVLIIGAWNYPVQLTLAPYVAALAAGNCAILKPSELAPTSSALMASLVPKYLDGDAVAVIEGDKETASKLLSLPFEHIFYTGGEVVGKIVMQAAAQHLTPVTLELGGKSPCVVEANTNIQTTARRIVWGKWTNAGQTCIAPDYVLVERGCANALTEALTQELRRQFGNQPLKSKDYGRIVNARHLGRLKQYIDGQEIIIGGQCDEAELKLAPTVILNPDIDTPVMQEEIFGPVLPVIEVSSVAEAMDFIKRRPKPLAAYLFSEQQATQNTFVEEISAGSICINDTMMFMANPQLPFGGVGHSGMGRYHGKFGFDTFSHQKSVMKRSFWFDVAIRYAPASARKRYLLKKLL
ncbi:aldehyde dehydrogenase family protein [Alteromonas lipolytica]|uniref:Aldehyde dehydrogenase n=1 Tax=Alteromonas lipolytica TaxID=1856405 RepID=A0A1E8F929_9ALTE|nr:aldehyde dehydrogenase family protein [Alteromonas lipolytica]OFI32429.1 aldehyde dehydrogenase [Alteromonas lipolytica]GGF79763.1 aldehyde dehydrogenase [Alteromonas lipolytica]